MGGAANLAGDAWCTQSDGFPFFTLHSSIYYCYAPATKTPAVCKEARLVFADDWRAAQAQARAAELKRLRDESARRKQEDLRRRNEAGDELLKPPPVRSVDPDID